jgi:hypothetical protein
MQLSLKHRPTYTTLSALCDIFAVATPYSHSLMVLDPVFGVYMHCFWVSFVQHRSLLQRSSPFHLVGHEGVPVSLLYLTSASLTLARTFHACTLPGRSITALCALFFALATCSSVAGFRKEVRARASNNSAFPRSLRSTAPAFPSTASACCGFAALRRREASAFRRDVSSGLLNRLFCDNCNARGSSFWGMC